MEYFLGADWFVDVYTNDLGSPMLELVQQLSSWGRLRVVVADPEAPFDDDYDLIWIQHSLLPPTMIDRLCYRGIETPIVWHHLSVFMNIEMPILAEIENRIASLSTGMSPAAVEAIMLFGLDPDHLLVFDNPAPDCFADATVSERNGRLERLLVVSNHAPEEVREAMGLVRGKGVHVEILGGQDGPRRVSPEILGEFDAVLTIGKTVPFALSMGIPCYVYDHFGGIGWLDDGNFEHEHFHAFSGRATRRMAAPDIIARELVEGYPDAAVYARDNRSAFAERWRMSRRMSELLSDPRIETATPIALTAEQARRYKSFLELYGDIYRLVVKLQSDVRGLQGGLAEAEAECAELRVQLGMAESRHRDSEEKERARQAEWRSAYRELRGTLDSPIWRVSAPVRWARARLRGHQPFRAVGLESMDARDLAALNVEIRRSRSWRMIEGLRGTSPRS
ncbi:hypothetical protein [Luethyella okanaganae]|uniref:Glycosyltransferase n=1 Tax=Luethyella okanaganae TaxID=69372 RepID=A0ABW1VFR1_9MICO